MLAAQKPASFAPAQRDKWIKITGDYVPSTVPGWSGAFSRVDRSARSDVTAPKEFTGYRVPDPGMIIFSEVRRERNVFAWLLSRSANLRRLSHGLDSETGVPAGVSNELWRVNLSTDIAASGMCGNKHVDRSSVVVFNGRGPAQQRRQVAVAIFGRPPDKFNLQHAMWRGHTISWGTTFHYNALLVQEIMWDLHWSSFRFDLVALDRYLLPAYWEGHRYECLDALSTIFGTFDALVYEDGRIEDSGIASRNAFERDRAYTALASLMDPWPLPPNCRNLASTDRLSVDHIAFQYCSTFAYVFGRPPVLPKLVPVATTHIGFLPYPATINRSAEFRGSAPI